MTIFGVHHPTSISALEIFLYRPSFNGFYSPYRSYITFFWMSDMSTNNPVFSYFDFDKLKNLFRNFTDSLLLWFITEHK